MKKLSLVLMTVLLFGCMGESNDWNTAVKEASIEGYEKYLSDHPEGAHAAEASSAIFQLKIAIAWSEAKSQKTVAGFQAFLKQYPRSRYSREALRAIDIDTAKRANSVMIDDNGASRIIGELEEHPSGEQGRPPLPKGPITVYVLRSASAEYLAKLKGAKIPVQVGSAYLWRKGQPISKARFIGKIDTNLTAEAIAAQFIPAK